MGISKIWVFGEANEAGASVGTLELLTKARTLAATVEVVMVGDALDRVLAGVSDEPFALDGPAGGNGPPQGAR